MGRAVRELAEALVLRECGIRMKSVQGSFAYDRQMRERGGMYSKPHVAILKLRTSRSVANPVRPRALRSQRSAITE